jgi:hypothetical protein
MGRMGDRAVHQGRTGAADGVMQVEAPLLPAALNRPFRHAPHRGDLREREAAEKLQLDDLRELRLDRGEFVERVTDLD